MVAVKNGFSQLVPLFLEEAKIQNNEGKTALMYACTYMTYSDAFTPLYQQESGIKHCTTGCTAKTRRT